MQCVRKCYFDSLAASLLFLNPDWPRRFWPARLPALETPRSAPVPWATLIVIAIVQLALPLRQHFYKGNVLWHEQGYRFAWNVMLMEKMGAAEFTVRNADTRILVDNRRYLTRAQEKAMATQPDMLLLFAHHLKQLHDRPGHPTQIFADVFVVLNGRPPQRLIDPKVDLGAVRDGFGPKQWILPAPGP